MNSGTSIFELSLTRKDQSFKAFLCLSDLSLNQLFEVNLRSPFLHDLEKARADSLKFEGRRLSYSLGRYCGKVALGAIVTDKVLNHLLIENGVFGQPVVNGKGVSGIGVSIGHSNNLGTAIAYPLTHPMSIDIEVPKTEHQEAVKKELTDAEMNLVSEWERKIQDPFTWIWTVKEALGKMLKSGMTVPLSLYEISKIDQTEELIVAEFKNFPQYKALSFVWQGSIVTIGLPRKTTATMKEMCNGLNKRCTELFTSLLK